MILLRKDIEERYPNLQEQIRVVEVGVGMAEKWSEEASKEYNQYLHRNRRRMAQRLVQMLTLAPDVEEQMPFLSTNSSPTITMAAEEKRLPSPPFSTSPEVKLRTHSIRSKTAIADCYLHIEGLCRLLMVELALVERHSLSHV